jgi:peptide chain release factor 3
VFFGSALRTFGVADLIDALAEFAPPPKGLQAETRFVEAHEKRMSGFVFKIQANMDPNHRDRIAFMRVSSGRLTRGMKAKLVRTGKPMALNAPQFFFAQERALAEEAFPGDVVGIPNHGTLRIGDTLTEGEDLVFRGVPSFAPEILRRVKLSDAMKAKKLREALQQMAEEGVVQTFVPYDGSGAMVGVVGALQLDVLAERLQAEYGLPVTFETSRFEIARWITGDDVEMNKFLAAYPSSTAADLDGAPVFMATSAFTLRYEQERWPAVTFSDIKDYQRAA